MPNPQHSQFARRLITWHQQHGRHNLPWQQNPTPYRVWLSEIMLQQTQYQTVIPYYHRFTERFANLKSLAEADIDEVLHLWSGLGYYARARNLHQCAKQVLAEFAGTFPTTVEELITLPGIGKSTAGAIIAFSSNQFAVILDGNVKRVLARYFAITDEVNKTATINTLWQLAEKLTPTQQTNSYTQAIMDLGAMVCTRSKPTCTTCPLKDSCQAHQQQLTNSIPRKTKKAPIPTKHSTFLLYTYKHQILLEQRPATGLWGGLWCFPETNTNALADINHPGKIMRQQQWASFRHTFSHFHLEITPVRIELATVKNIISDDTQRDWFDIHQPPAKGLAKPVSVLLKQLQEEVIT